MKFIVCVIAAFAAVQYVGAQSTTDVREFGNQFNIKTFKASLDSSRDRAAVDTFKRKLTDICPGRGNKIDKVIKEIVECAEAIDETEETMCSVVKNHVKTCLNPLTALLEECLPPQAKQIPVMVLDMIISVSNHLCRTDGEHIFELGNACIKNINPKTQRCIRTLASRFQQYERKESVPTAADLCDVFQALRPCLQSHLNTACGHPITRESYLSVFDESMKTCKNYQKNEIDVIDVDANF